MRTVRLYTCVRCGRVGTRDYVPHERQWWVCEYPLTCGRRAAKVRRQYAARREGVAVRAP